MFFEKLNLMKMRFQPINLIVLLLVLPLWLNAQFCQVPGVVLFETSAVEWSGPTSDVGGQTFVACQTGIISSLNVTFSFANSGDATAQFFIEQGNGDAVIGINEHIQNISIPPGGMILNIPLTTPFSVISGQTYIFGFISDQPIQVAANSTNLYSAGFIRDINDAVDFLNHDFVFDFNIIGCSDGLSDFTAPEIVVMNSTCTTPGGTPAGGSIMAPTTDLCPEGSELEYSIDNGDNWSTIIPSTYTTTSMTIQTRCKCIAIPTTISKIASVTTEPEICPIAIPTMSQWGLMIFGLLILNLSLVIIRRKEMIFG